MSDERPPWPGPEPERLDFPFARAQAALDAINALVEQLEDLGSAVGNGIADLNAGSFEGEFSTWFTGAGDDLQGRIESRVTTLEAQASDLVDHIAAARQSIRDRDVARYWWGRSHAAWANWEAPVPRSQTNTR